MRFLSNPCICTLIVNSNLSVFIKFNFSLLAFIFFLEISCVCIIHNVVLELEDLFPNSVLCGMFFSTTCHFFPPYCPNFLTEREGKPSHQVLQPHFKIFCLFCFEYRRQRSPVVAYQQLENLRKRKVVHCRIRC